MGKNSVMPNTINFGNGIQTIKYNVNGESSDWMLGKRGIISYSVELGDKSPKTDIFDPKPDAVQTILKADFPMIDLMLKE